jgi:hypothetical protein
MRLRMLRATLGLSNVLQNVMILVRPSALVVMLWSLWYVVVAFIAISSHAAML